MTLLILLDLSSAFDIVDHLVPVDCLASLGVSGTALTWFSGSPHSSRISPSGYSWVERSCHHRSRPVEFHRGLFSPWCYLTSICALWWRLSGGLEECHQYANDTQFCLLFKEWLVAGIPVLVSCLDAVVERLGESWLKLNQSQIVRLGKLLGWPPLLILGGVHLSTVDAIRTLGVWVNSMLSVDKQESLVTKSEFYRLHWVYITHQLAPYLSQEDLAQHIHSTQ